MEQTQPISPRVGAKTDRGKVRTENQDRIDRFESPFGQVFIVADGMGGHEGGATAAKMLADGLQHHLRGLPSSLTPAEALQAAASRANAEIHERANSGDPKTAQMGATSVLVLMRGNQVTIAHAGDSRAYLLRAGELSRLTRDHTVIQRMLDHNMLSPEEARDHPDASVVTRAFGQKPDIELEISPPFELQPGDRLLLCSDGLCGYVDDDRIRQVLTRGGDAQAIADALISLALDAGGEDNVSVQVLAAEGAAGPRGAAVPPLAPAPRRASSWIFIVLLLLAAFLLGLVVSKSWNRWKGKQAGVEETPKESLSKDQKLIQRLLAPLGGVTFRAAGDGFEAGRIYFRDNDNAKEKVGKILQKLGSKRQGKPRYQEERWPEELPSDLEEELQHADVVIVWLDGKSGSANATPPASTPPSANSPSPASSPPLASAPSPEETSPPAAKPGNETPKASGEPKEIATPGKPSSYIGPAGLGEHVEILSNLLSGLTHVATRTPGAGLEGGRVYFRKSREAATQADEVVRVLNQKAPRGKQYQKEAWPQRAGVMPQGIDVIVATSPNAKGNHQ